MQLTAQTYFRTALVQKQRNLRSKSLPCRCCPLTLAQMGRVGITLPNFCSQGTGCTIHPGVLRWLVGWRTTSWFKRLRRFCPVWTRPRTRQRFQCAFGQEFICSFEALMDYLGTALPDSSVIEWAAE